MNILLMNAGNRKSDRAIERKEKISEIVRGKDPDVVLFQEFTWKRLQGKGFTIPEKYKFVGHDEAAILYNEEKVEVKDIPATLIDTSLNGFPSDFTPKPRMCIRIIRNKGNKKLDFICVSWHGQHTGLKDEKKKEHFKFLLEFVLKIGDKYGIPILIGGDFNIAMEGVSEIVERTGKLEICPYKASSRRLKNGVIDFFIKSRSAEFQVLDTEYVDLVKENAESLFDHDPIICTIQSLEELVRKIDIDENTAYSYVTPKSLAPYIKHQRHNLLDLHIESIMKGSLKCDFIRIVGKNNYAYYVNFIYNCRYSYRKGLSDLEHGRKKVTKNLSTHIQALFRFGGYAYVPLN